MPNSISDTPAVNTIVLDVAASPIIAFGTGGVSAGNPALIPQTAPLTGPATPWFLAQWHKLQYLNPNEFKSDDLILDGAGIGVPLREWETPDDTSEVQIIQAADGSFITHLHSSGGTLTPEGGSNLFLQASVAPGITLAKKLTRVSDVY